MLSKTTILMLCMKSYPRVLAMHTHKDSRRGEKCHSHSLPSLLYPHCPESTLNLKTPSQTPATLSNLAKTPYFMLNTHITPTEEEERGWRKKMTTFS
jgi:hypothetical protein